MRLLGLIAFGLAAAAVPAAAQFNASYEGTQREDGKDVPATAQFSVGQGRVAVVMKSGAHSFRMLFTEKDGRLRVVDDAGKSYFDLDRKALEGMGTGAMDEARKELAKLPPEQRAMAEKMMGNAMTDLEGPPPSTYVWSKDTQKVKGYDCTRVDVMQGDVKRAEYWGSSSPDFKMSPGDRATVLAMQGALRDFMIKVVPAGGGGGESRAFQWDTSTEGFPLVSRCFEGDVATVDLHLASFDRKPQRDELFKIPDGYKPQEIDPSRAGGRGHRRSK